MKKFDAFKRAMKAAANRVIGPPEKRFWAKVEKRGDNECWHWKGATHERGYGEFWMDRKRQRAPRVAYLLTVGEIPEGLVVRHSCDNPPCVNPAHLSLGTDKDNMQDAVSRGRSVGSGRRLHPDERIEIGRRLNKGEPRKAVQERFKVSTRTLDRCAVEYRTLSADGDYKREED